MIANDKPKDTGIKFKFIHIKIIKFQEIQNRYSCYNT